MRARHLAARVMRPLVVRRRFHAFGVGAGKSGTTSLARVLRSEYRAAHEAGADDLIRHIRLRSAGKLTDREWRRYVARRDRRLWLEMESSQLLAEIIDVLVERFPEARFVLTIRHPYPWLVSAVTHELTQPIDEEWRWWADYRYGRIDRDRLEERSLTERGLYNLDAYLDFWVRHNQRVLDTVPSSRLLVIRTDSLSARLPDLARFLGVPPETLDHSASHEGRSRQAADVLSELDPDYVARQIRERCGPLLERFFPGEGVLI